MNEPMAIIMGYGVPPDILKDGNYECYLKAALDKVILQKNVTRVVLCGGHTNVHYPEKTEAAEMLRLMQHLLPAVTDTLVCNMVADSITGWENMEGAAVAVYRNATRHVYIVCEKTRSAKVWLTAKLTLPADTHIEMVGVDFDATRTWKKDWKQYFGVFVVAAEHIFPGLRRVTRQRQLRHIKRVSQK